MSSLRDQRPNAQRCLRSVDLLNKPHVLPIAVSKEGGADCFTNEQGHAVVVGMVSNLASNLLNLSEEGRWLEGIRDKKSTGGASGRALMMYRMMA